MEHKLQTLIQVKDCNLYYYGTCLVHNAPLHLSREPLGRVASCLDLPTCLRFTHLTSCFTLSHLQMDPPKSA